MLHDTLAEIYRAHRGQGALFAGPGGRRHGARCAMRRSATWRAAASRRTSPASRRISRKARNATDEVGALSMLAELRSPERAKAFDRFYERWKDDHLVIDNWFAYQAASPLASALATVKKLTRHPLFSIKNPNKVRALIGTFAMANPVNFNRPDGRGYEFVADRVLEIDAFNPQIAARLLSAFRSWKALGARAPASCQEDPAAHRQDQAAVARCVRDRVEDARVETRTQLPYFCLRIVSPLDNPLGSQSN